MQIEEKRAGQKTKPLQLHATSVCFEGCAVLIIGESGSGKSALALQLMAYGAALIADDRTDVVLSNGWPHAVCPDRIRGMVEARGVGILSANPSGPAPVVLIVTLDETETQRLPPERYERLLDRRIRLLHKTESAHFAPAIMQYLRTARPRTQEI